ncbi:MAG TPA: response regulator [Polyangiaceae bacterium]|nr:response regulator [Polyangiaceae bacterium]
MAAKVMPGAPALAGGAAPGADERAQRKPLVLNVNDNEGARYMTSVMLRRAGFDVLEANDGTTALELAEQLPDVIVLDVRLPDIDGFEVCRRIRANPRTARLKLLHTSATFVTLEKKVQGLEVGADGYLSQPFEMQELIATIQSLIRLGRAESELHDRADQLQEASQRKDEFLAMLAHELRNPLSAISACLPQLTRQSAANDREARARDIVERQVHHLGKLVDDLLDVARVTQGKIELHQVVVDVTRLLQRVASGARDTKATPRRQTVSLQLPDSPVFVQGDPTRLEQIFINLLDNASKYTDAGGTIQVVASPFASDGQSWVRIAIVDSGIGMAADSLSTIFGLFSQANVGIDRSRGGLGIGLTLVRTLVELHGGRITASSGGIGEGSQFVVELPSLVADEQRPTPPPRALPSRATPRRILIVEDNTDVRDGLVELCQMWGHEVFTAGDGLEGVRVALEQRPDVAFVDIGLPGIDGYEVARRVRADGPCGELLLVALTGYGSKEQKALAVESGFDHHLVKPVDTKQIEDMIADLDHTRETSHRARVSPD